MKGNNDEVERKAKPSMREIFGICGPLHLSCIDWRLLDHRRSVAASLVQGVYILERDRQQKRIGHNALAPIWWDFFHFQCVQILVDKVDSSIFGAIFEHKYHNPNHFHPMDSQTLPPKYVIAFRGTITKHDTRKQDLYLDIQLPLNRLPRCSRYEIAFQVVENILSRVGHRNVWLAGHSLGAAIALQAGKDMAKRGCYIESYLFNPPFITAPTEKLNNHYLKSGARIANSVVKAGLSLALNGTKNNTQQHDPFTILSSWIPYLFVNPNDPICCEYIGYFEHREKMEGWGMGGIERVATKNSAVGLVSGALGKEGEALHLIPSAYVTKNMVVKENDFKVAHGIHQWWEPHPYWQPKLYQFRFLAQENVFVREDFGICGPQHLTSLDWTLPEHRRSVAASLIQGVFVLERDRQEKRKPHDALAPIWWNFFQYQCFQILVDPIDSSIFGIIFEHTPHKKFLNHFFPKAKQSMCPRYVIAFRGTVIRRETRKRDLLLDIKLVLNNLAGDSRYKLAIQAVESIVAKVGPQNVWLAGHSLGAGIALHAGKDMAKTGCYIETYLFNPPYVSAPIEKINNPNLRNGARIARSFINAGLSVAVNGTSRNNTSHEQNDPFSTLCSWTPYLFLNPKDPISCEYIGYFKHREKMEGWGAGRIERIATKISVVSVLSGALGREGEALRLIPSALVTKNVVDKEQDLMAAHGLIQWWEPHSYWHSKTYQLSLN